VSVLDRKLGRDLAGAKGLLAAIAAIMTIGVACFVALGSAHRNLADAQTRYYAQCRMADFSIELKKVPLSEIDLIAALPGVTEVRPRIQFFVTVDLEQVEEPLSGLVLSLPERREPTINDIVLTRGSYFTDHRAEEVIVNDAFAAKHDIHPGDHLHLILNNRRQELFVVGTAISSEFVYAVGKGSIIPDPEHFGVFYLKRSYMEDVFGFQGACNQIIGLLAPDVREKPDPILRRCEDLLASFGVFTTIPRKDQSSHRFLSNEIQGLRTFAVAMPTIFLVVAALVLNVLLSRLIENQRTVIGTLKALGYSDLRMLVHYLKFGLTVGIFGGIVGSLGGHTLAGWMTQVYRTFFEFPELENRAYPWVYLSGLLVSLACAAAGTAQGVRMVLRLEPAEAMRPKPPRQGGRILLERVGWFWSRLGTPWRMTLRNVVRNRVRTLVGVFASAMGAGLLSYALIALVAVRYLVDFQFQEIWRSDIDLSFESERGIDALREVERLPGVDYAEPFLSVGCTFIHGPYERRAGITGLIPTARLTVPRDDQGRPVRVPTTGLVMSRTLADMLHVSPGDSVVVRPTKGLREERSVQVVAVTDSYIGTAVYADLDFLSRLVHEEFAISGAQIMINPDPKVKQQLFRELKELPSLGSYSARIDAIENLIVTFVDTNRVFVGILVAFSGVIFFGSTLNAALIGLAERQREVATLLVVGYQPHAVGGLFLREALLVNTVGTFLGMPLGYLLTILMASVYNSEMFRIPVLSPPEVWIKTAVLGVVFSLTSHAILQWKINRTDWWEALRVKE